MTRLGYSLSGVLINGSSPAGHVGKDEWNCSSYTSSESVPTESRKTGTPKDKHHKSTPIDVTLPDDLYAARSEPSCQFTPLA